MSAQQSQELLRAAQALLLDLWKRPEMTIDSLRLMDSLQAAVDSVTEEQA